MIHDVILAIGIIFFLLALWGLIRLFNSTANSLEWVHLVSTTNQGIQFADWNKIGQGLGVILCTWLPLAYAYSPKMDAGGLALVMTVSLAYLGAVSSYAATLRSKRGGIETTTTTESPSRTTETVKETAP